MELITYSSAKNLFAALQGKPNLKEGYRNKGDSFLICPNIIYLDGVTKYNISGRINLTVDQIMKNPFWMARMFSLHYMFEYSNSNTQLANFIEYSLDDVFSELSLAKRPPFTEKVNQYEVDQYFNMFRPEDKKGLRKSLIELDIILKYAQPELVQSLSHALLAKVFKRGKTYGFKKGAEALSEDVNELLKPIIDLCSLEA